MMPKTWAELTKEGSINPGPFETMLLQVATTMRVLGWPAARDLHEIQLEEWQLEPFRRGLIATTQFMNRIAEREARRKAKR